MKHLTDPTVEQLPNEIMWIDLFNMSCQQEIIFENYRLKKRKCKKKKFKLTDLAGEETLNTSSKERITGVQSVMALVKEEDSEDSYIKDFGIKPKEETYLIPEKSSIMLEYIDHFVYIEDDEKILHVALLDEGEVLKIRYQKKIYHIWKQNDAFNFDNCFEKTFSKLQLILKNESIVIKKNEIAIWKRKSSYLSNINYSHFSSSQTRSLDEKQFIISSFYFHSFSRSHPSSATVVILLKLVEPG
jgi:hypothetical protein